MNNKEFGAYLIACGKIMLQESIPYSDVEIYHKSKIISHMIEEGIKSDRVAFLVLGSNKQDGIAWSKMRGIH